MYCPKCGSKNPDSGKYCRKCGTGLPKEFADEDRFEFEGSSDDALATGSSGRNQKPQKAAGTRASWESAIVLFASGIGFLIVSIVLAFQPMGFGWWFWMLIPGFGGIGGGIGQYVALRKQERENVRLPEGDTGRQVTGKDRGALPPTETVFAEDEFRMPEGDRELAPHSVTEGTTRNLELDLENDTAKLPDKE